MDILGVHKLKKNESLEMLSAYYRIPVCMIIRANEGLKLEDKSLPRELKIPKKCFCNDCALNPLGTYSEK